MYPTYVTKCAKCKIQVTGPYYDAMEQATEQPQVLSGLQPDKTCGCLPQTFSQYTTFSTTALFFGEENCTGVSRICCA